MTIATFLVIVAAILALVDAFAYHRAVGWNSHWLLSIAVFIGMVGVLLGPAPLHLQ